MENSFRYTIPVRIPFRYLDSRGGERTREKKTRWRKLAKRFQLCKLDLFFQRRSFRLLRGKVFRILLFLINGIFFGSSLVSRELVNRYSCFFLLLFFFILAILHIGKYSERILISIKLFRRETREKFQF